MNDPRDLLDFALQLADHALVPPWQRPLLHVERRIRGIRDRTNVAQTLAPGPAFALHLIPQHDVELELTPLQQMPLLFNGTTRDTRIVHDGYLGTAPARDGGLRAYTHLRRDGVVEAVETRLLAQRTDAAGRTLGMPARGFDHGLAAAMTQLAGLVRQHHAAVEFTAFFSILDAGHRWFEVSDGMTDSERFLDDRILLPCVDVEDDLQNVSERLSTYIWQAVGYARSPYEAAALTR